MGPNYFIFMGNFKIMTRLCMPRHARAYMFLTLSLYMIMQFLLIWMYYSLPSKHFHVCLSVCLCTDIHVSVCTCVCMYRRTDGWMHACMDACMYHVYLRTYVLVPRADPVFWPSGLDPLPLTKILDPRMGQPGCPSIH